MLWIQERPGYMIPGLFGHPGSVFKIKVYSLREGFNVVLEIEHREMRSGVRGDYVVEGVTDCGPFFSEKVGGRCNVIVRYNSVLGIGVVYCS